MLGERMVQATFEGCKGPCVNGLSFFRWDAPAAAGRGRVRSPEYATALAACFYCAFGPAARTSLLTPLS